VTAIVEVWTAGAREVVVQLRQHTIAPNQLTSVGWRLNLEMADASRANVKEPNVLWEFGVTDTATQVQSLPHRYSTNSTININFVTVSVFFRIFRMRRCNEMLEGRGGVIFRYIYQNIKMGGEGHGGFQHVESVGGHNELRGPWTPARGVNKNL